MHMEKILIQRDIILLLKQMKVMQKAVGAKQVLHLLMLKDKIQQLMERVLMQKDWGQ